MLFLFSGFTVVSFILSLLLSLDKKASSALIGGIVLVGLFGLGSLVTVSVLDELHQISHDVLLAILPLQPLTIVIYEILHYTLTLRRLSSLRRNNNQLLRALNELYRIVWIIVFIDLVAISVYVVGIVTNNDILITMHANANVLFYKMLIEYPMFKPNLPRVLELPKPAEGSVSETIVTRSTRD